MSEIQVSDELWERFHQLVNMTSPELADWLRVQSAGEETEELPDRSGRRLGRRVLDILGKRRVDLTSEDVAAMAKVVSVVESQRGVDLEPTAGDDHWRHALMSIGHDPLKPA